MRLLLIGSDGQLGHDLLRAAEGRGYEVVASDPPETDLTDPASLARALDSASPEVVLCTGAFHDLDRCEREPERAFAVNALGIGSLSRLCAGRGIRFLTYSTDYVFHRSSESRPLHEEDLPNPMSVYAASKRAGEMLALAAHPQAVVIRTCGLYGAHPPKGKAYNFPGRIVDLARSGKPLRIVKDQICTPTATHALAEQTMLLVEGGISGLVHATCQGACSWAEFARKVLELSGRSETVTEIESGEYPSIAPRPPYSVLDNRRLREAGLDRMPSWEDALARHVESMAR